MSFLLKIVEGPNKGAEIALVEGVAVTFGKSEDCDIVIADSTMPAEPMKLEASEADVTINGEALEPLQVKTVGATSFAVGPADAPWGELVWPSSEKPKVEGPKVEEPKVEGTDKSNPEEPVDKQSEKRSRHGCVGCLLAMLALLMVLIALVWVFRGRIKECDWSKWHDRFITRSRAGDSSVSGVNSPATLESIAEKYGLTFANEGTTSSLSGNLATRRERLAATAEAYEAMPGVELDITDDESFRTAAEDALFTLTEGALKVSVATNRFLRIVGSSPSPAALKKTIEALNGDLPKLRDVDMTGVGIRSAAVSKTADAVHDETAPTPVSDSNPKRYAAKRSHNKKTEFPVCGIFTVPYPCLVLRDGKRIFEGASIGDSVILKIEADSVTVTNSTGRFEWKP